jgi:hypothetical protein
MKVNAGLKLKNERLCRDETRNKREHRFDGDDIFGAADEGLCVGGEVE